MEVYGGYIQGHDAEFHIANISSILEELSIEKLLVQEPLKFIGNNFGYGTRFFYPPLPHLLSAYITKTLSIFNLESIAIGMRITEGLCFFASGVTFFYLALKILKNEKISLILSLFYMSAPYHLTQVFIRDAFSEMFIPVAIPLILLGLLYLVENDHKKFLFCFVSGYALAVYSHMAMSIYFTLMIIVTFFTVYFRQIFTKKNILYLLLGCVLILLLTASFWIPLLEFKIKNNIAIFVPYLLPGKGALAYSTLKPVELIKFTIFHDGNMIFHLPIFIEIILVTSIVYLFKKKLWKEKIWIFVLLFTVLSIIMQTSLFPWRYTPSILQTLQFPWRLAIYMVFGTILLCGIFIKQFENHKNFNKICMILIALTIFSAYYYIGHLDKAKVDETNIDYSYGMGNELEYLPKRAFDNKDYLENREEGIVIISGEGETNITLNDVPTLVFDANISEKMTAELPRIYYIGYSLKNTEGEEIPLEESEKGFLQANLEKSGTYILTYEKTAIMRISNIISIITSVALMIIIARHKTNMADKNQ